MYSPRELDVVECGMLLAVQETGVEAGMHSAAVITDGILDFSSTSLYAQHTTHITQHTAHNTAHRTHYFQ